MFAKGIGYDATPEMRESNSFGSPNEKKEEAKDNQNISTDITPEKLPAPSNPNANGDDISPEGLLEVIN